MSEEKSLKPPTLRPGAKSSSDQFLPREALNASAQRTIADGRSSLRHSVSASAEAVEPDSRNSLTCRVTDLSMGGCYLDTLNPFDAGTIVNLRLMSEGRVFQTEAQVLYVTPRLGMGLAFTKMTPEQLEVLSTWMRALDPDVTAPGVANEVQFGFAEQTKSAAPEESLREIVGELVTLLARKQILTHSEALEMQRKLSLGE